MLIAIRTHQVFMRRRSNDRKTVASNTKNQFCWRPTVNKPAWTVQLNIFLYCFLPKLLKWSRHRSVALDDGCGNVVSFVMTTLGEAGLAYHEGHVQEHWVRQYPTRRGSLSDATEPQYLLIFSHSVKPWFSVSDFPPRKSRGNQRMSSPSVNPRPLRRSSQERLISGGPSK